jgi:predicted amidohydrolase
VDPWGETIAGAAEQETMVLADVDAAQVSEARARLPTLQDRRLPHQVIRTS